FKVNSDDEALQVANDTQYGLGSAVFAPDAERAPAFAEQLDAGMVGPHVSPEQPADVPFGGVKRSGYGCNLGPLGIDEFGTNRWLHPTHRQGRNFRELLFVSKLQGRNSVHCSI